MNLQIVIVGSEDWKTSLGRFWRFLTVKEGRRKHNKAITIELNLRRGLFFSLFAAIALYFAGAVALYGWRLTVRNNHIGFADVLIAPFTLDRISRLQGQTNLDNARELLEQGKFSDAFYNYRAGVARLPEDFEARLELAQFYIAAGYVPEGTDLLVRGLEHGYPENPDYLKLMLASIQYVDNNPALLKFIPKMLAFPEVKNSRAKRVAMLQLLLRAQLVEQDFAGVIATSHLLNEEKLEKTFYDTALFARLKMGAFADAESYLESIPESEKKEPDIRLLEAILIYEDRDRSAGRQAFQALFREFPNQWKLQMDAIMFLYQEGDRRASRELMNVYATLHRRNAAALAALAGRLTDAPDSEKVLEFASMIGEFHPQFFGALSFYYVQSLITEGDFAKANQEMELLRPAAPADENEAVIFDAYDLIVKAGVGRSKGEFAALRNHLAEHRLPPEVYWEAAEALRKIGEFSTAEMILNSALGKYPFDRSLSRIRDLVLQQSSDVERRTSEVVASIRDEGYTSQRVSSTDQIGERLVGDNPAVGVPETIVTRDDVVGIEIDAQDFNQSAEVD